MANLPAEILRLVNTSVANEVRRQVGILQVQAGNVARAVVQRVSTLPETHDLDPAGGYHSGTLPEADVSFDVSGGHDHDGSNSRQVDHGNLLGLADDDHTQYLNTTRHDTTTRHTLGTVVPHDDHGALSGLADDDHTQYALLLGRSGGQSLSGGTGASDDLVLHSTTNATKGQIFFGDAVNSIYFDEATGNFSFGSKSLQSVADPTNAQDAATKNYVDTSVSGLASVATGTATLDASGQALSVSHGLGAVNVALVITEPGNQRYWSRYSLSSSSYAKDNADGTFDIFATASDAGLVVRWWAFAA